MPYLSAYEVMIHEDSLYQVYESLPLPLPVGLSIALWILGFLAVLCCVTTLGKF